MNEDPKFESQNHCPICGLELIRSIDEDFGYVESCRCGYEREEIFS